MPSSTPSPPIVSARAASADDLEEVAMWMADALDDWAYRGEASNLNDADAACNLADQLRVLGSLAAVDGVEASNDAAAQVGDALHRSLMNALELLAAPPNSGPRRRFDPAPGFVEPASVRASDEDEETVVRKPMRGRHTNRILG